MTRTSPSEFFKEVRNRLQAAEGWPSEVYRNRGRLAVWQDAGNGNEGKTVGNVVDGNPNYVSTLGGARGPVEEFDQRCLVEFLAHQADDDARSDLIDAAMAGLLDALMPRLMPDGPRDLRLGGLVGQLKIVQVNREGYAVDSTPHISGFQLVLEAALMSETMIG